MFCLYLRFLKFRPACSLIPSVFSVFTTVLLLYYFCQKNMCGWCCWLPACFLHVLEMGIHLSALLPGNHRFFRGQTDRENHTAAAKKLLLCISIVTNLGLLFYFKYFNFFWTALIQQLYYLEARPYCIVRRFFFPLGSPSTPFRV